LTAYTGQVSNRLRMHRLLLGSVLVVLAGIAVSLVGIMGVLNRHFLKNAIWNYRHAFDTFAADPFKNELKASDILGYVQTVRTEEGLDQIMLRLWALRGRLTAEVGSPDAIHAGNSNPCGNDSPVPCDDDGHGTHTTGTAVGDDGAGNQIGMAPGAKWIACRNEVDDDTGTPASYLECMEFFLAPYPVHGTPNEADPSKAPDITSNSWGCFPQFGCSPRTLQAAVEAQVAAGIMMVVAAGNDGPNCSTVIYPPCIYEAAYTVGALETGTDSIAYFSSRGPVMIDQSNRIKPNITAPGTETRSSYNTSDDAYYSSTGTSMASPHVAGAVALLWSARPELQNDISSTRSVLDRAAVHILDGVCDGGPPVTPNNTYGNGRLDILAAVNTRAIPTPRLHPTPAPRP